MCRSVCIVGMIAACLLVLGGCGQSSAALESESTGSATDAVTGPCRADTDCVLADMSCGSCACPTAPVTRAALDERHEECRDVDVRCAVPQCPASTQHAACVDNRCVAVADAGRSGSAVTRGSTEEETRCTANDECTSVPTDCCPCTSDDWVPSNQASNGAVTARNRPARCDTCPSQDCPPFDRLCVDGHCVIQER